MTEKDMIINIIKRIGGKICLNKNNIIEAEFGGEIGIIEIEFDEQNKVVDFFC